VMTVAVQLAMGQFSPRIVAALLRDRLHQFSFALFGATIAFGIVALTGIDDQHDRVPGLTVLVTYVLTFASFAALVVYISHAGERLRPSGLIDLVGDHLHEEIARAFPADRLGAPLQAGVIAAPESGVIVDIDTGGLVAAAVRADCRLEVGARMGDFVPRGAPLVRVVGADADRLQGVEGLIAIHDERTHQDDPAYGVRKLVDIAVRSAADDPTTTVQALHRIHDALRQLAWRPFPSGRHCDAEGRVRVTVPVREWADFVELAFEEVRVAGAGQPGVARRLRAALEDLLTVAGPERGAPLQEQLERLDRAVDDAYADERVAWTARQPNVEGFG